jgi:endoglucanase
LPVKIAEAGLNWKAATPELYYGSGTYYAPLSVVITSQTPGAVVHYTTEPREPLESDPVPPPTIMVDRETMLRAKAWKPGMPESNSDSEEYHFQLGSLSVSPFPGHYNSTQTATLSCTTPGVTIRYTTDGSPPTSPSALVYTGAIAVNNSMTIRALAVRDGWLPSGEITATYTLHLGTLSPPAITPQSGVTRSTDWNPSPAAPSTPRR